MPISAPDPEAPPFRWWRITWRLARRPALVLAQLRWRLQIRRDGELPDGAVVFAANHVSHLDGPIVGAAVGRPTRFLAVDGLWTERWWLGVVLHLIGAIPLSRTRAPLGALRVALAHLREGGSIGVFPEGGIQPGWGAARPHPATGWLCLRSGASLIPVAVSGTERAAGGPASRRRSVITVRFGPAIDPVDFEGREDPEEAMMEAWSRSVEEMLGA